MVRSSALRRSGAILSAAATLVPAGGLAQAPPKPVLMREIEEPDKLDQQWPATLCGLPGLGCSDGHAPRLFETRSASPEFYAIVNPTTLARLNRGPAGDWRLSKRWSFSGYPLQPRIMDGRPNGISLDIHPALYPAGPGLWAVAVLARQTETYSGGSLETVRADFVLLEPEATDLGVAHRLYADVSFSCRRSIRACFSAKDYKTSAHCHDEASGHLTLGIAPAAGRSLHGWSATWHETVWPAGVPKSRQTKTSKTIPLSPVRPAGEPTQLCALSG